MNVFEHLLEETEIPSMVPVEFQVKRGRIKKEDIWGIIRSSIRERDLLCRLEPGKTVAVTFYISEALAEEAAVNPLLKIIGKPEEITFDRVGNVKWLPPVHNSYGYHSPS